MLSSIEELILTDIALQQIFPLAFRTLPQIPTALAPDWPLDPSDSDWRSLIAFNTKSYI